MKLMQTNGYFNEKKALWIAKNIDLLWFSLDGLQEIQDKQRPTVDKRSSFNIIDKNISIINKFKKTKIGIRATISEYNVYKQKELIDYALKNKLIAVFADPWGSLKKEKGKPDLRIYADEFLRTWEYARKKNIF